MRSFFIYPLLILLIIACAQSNDKNECRIENDKEICVEEEDVTETLGFISDVNAEIVASERGEKADVPTVEKPIETDNDDSDDPLTLIKQIEEILSASESSNEN